MFRKIRIAIGLLLQRNRCFGCGTKLTRQNDSEAHVIPNALGGRLAPRGLICRQCNTWFGQLADDDLVKAFGAWPTLLDIPRHRGKNPPQVVDTRAGYKVRIEADGSMTPVDPLYQSAQVPEGTDLQIGAGNWKMFRQLLKRAHKQHPQFDPKEAEKHAQIVKLPKSDIIAPISFTVAQTFGGVALCIWLFLVHRTRHAVIRREDLERTVRDFQASGNGLRYLMGGMPGLNGPTVELGHKIVVCTNPRKGELVAYVEILGALRIGGVFARCPPSDQAPVVHMYVYDLEVRRDRTSEFTVDQAVVFAQDWSRAGLGLGEADGPQLQQATLAAMQPLVRRFEARGAAPQT